MTLLTSYCMAIVVGVLLYWILINCFKYPMGFLETIFLCIGFLLAFRQFSVWEYGTEMILAASWAILSNLWIAWEWEGVRIKKVSIYIFIGFVIILDMISVAILK